MVLRIVEENAATLADYGRISIAFRVESRVTLGFQLESSGILVETLVDPWTKDYDSFREHKPRGLVERFNLDQWGILAAFDGNVRVGGIIVAWNTSGVDMLEGRDDLAAIFDLRVATDRRGEGIGRALFGAVEDWAWARGCRHLQVETQDINVPACRFYQAQGCRIIRVVPDAYPEAPDEAQIIWGKSLAL